MPTSKPHSIWVIYSVALLSVAAAILFRWLLDPFLGDQLQLVTLYGAVAMAVWVGGWRPALLAGIAGYVAARYLFISPRFTFDFGSPLIWAGVVGYSLSCGIIIYLGDAMRRAREDVEQRSSQLEEEIVERTRIEEQLRANEERLGLATQAGKIGIWEWDIPKNRISWTDSLFAMHGVTKEKFNATVEGFAALVHPGDREFVSRAIDRTLKEGAPYELIFRAVKPGGEVVWLFTNAMVVRDGREPIRMIGTTADITDLKLTEEALSRAKGQAEEANRAKDRFLAMLSHELRTPLTPVLMIASALEGDRTIATDLREQLGMIRRNIELEAKLIDDLLDVTRIAHGKLELREETVDVHAAIDHALSISALDLGGKKLHVTKRFDATEHHCRGDAARLQEVFWNILRNAVKFTPEAGKIDISTSNDDGRVVIEFGDTGIGIEPELQPRMFDAFEQGARTHGVRHGGLGLGLAISKRIIDLHEGTIEARSGGPGQGSTFSIKLNTISAPQSDVQSHASPAKSPADALAQILIVEDHKDTSDVLRRILENNGYAAKVCSTTEEARVAAGEQKFDLVISDIALSDGSGLDLMRDLSETQGLSGIALSGFGTQEDVAASKEAGFAVHLTKPVDLELLRTTIAKLLDLEKPIERQAASA